MSYDSDTLRRLSALTTDFYARKAASFSATRQAPWDGWDRALAAVAEADPALLAGPLRLLDVGCGNLRFERFLAERSEGPLSVIALDNCDPLVSTASPAPATAEIDFRSLDIATALIDGDLERHLPQNSCAMAVAFGFMHHLAAPAQRRALLDGLAGAVRPGGFVLVSFWQFLRDGRIAAKAAAATDRGRAALGLPAFAPGDYLLGWQHAEDVYRFCHHATDGEIDGLIGDLSLSCREIARFSADGKSGDLNCYVVLRRLL